MPPAVEAQSLNYWTAREVHEGGIDYGSGKSDSDGGGRNDVGSGDSGKGKGGATVANGGHIFGGKMTIVLDGGDSDSGVGIRMVEVLVKMILLMPCVGDDSSGIGVSASGSTVFDDVGDTCLS